MEDGHETLDTAGCDDTQRAAAPEATHADQETLRVPSAAPARALRRCLPGRAREHVPVYGRGSRGATPGCALHGLAVAGVQRCLRRRSGRTHSSRCALADGAGLFGCRVTVGFARLVAGISCTPHRGRTRSPAVGTDGWVGEGVEGVRLEKAT